MSRDTGRVKGTNKDSDNKKALFLSLGLRDKKKKRNKSQCYFYIPERNRKCNKRG